MSIGDEAHAIPEATAVHDPAQAGPESLIVGRCLRFSNRARSASPEVRGQRGYVGAPSAPTA